VKYRSDLIQYREPVRPDRDTIPRGGPASFISPYGDAPARFYGEFHRSLSEEGFTFVKIDNQLVVERMAGGNFSDLGRGRTLPRGAQQLFAGLFNNTMIN